MQIWVASAPSPCSSSHQGKYAPRNRRSWARGATDRARSFVTWGPLSGSSASKARMATQLQKPRKRADRWAFRRRFSARLSSENQGGDITIDAVTFRHRPHIWVPQPPTTASALRLQLLESASASLPARSRRMGEPRSGDGPRWPGCPRSFSLIMGSPPRPWLHRHLFPAPPRSNAVRKELSHPGWGRCRFHSPVDRKCRSPERTSRRCSSPGSSVQGCSARSTARGLPA